MFKPSILYHRNEPTVHQIPLMGTGDKAMTEIRSRLQRAYTLEGNGFIFLFQIVMPATEEIKCYNREVRGLQMMVLLSKTSGGGAIGPVTSRLRRNKPDNKREKRA